MNTQELELQLKRIEKFRKISEVIDGLRSALRNLTEPVGSEKNPFTSDYRESRLLLSATFHFSPTIGGAPATSWDVEGMSIAASAVGMAIQKIIEDRLKLLIEERDAI